MTSLRRTLAAILYASAALLVAAPSQAQMLGKPDSGSPGDAMIQAYLAKQAIALDRQYADDLKSLEQWQAKRPQYVEEYFYMLGLSPRPEKTPLAATVTGTIEGEGYVVENLHYQSVPRLYVTGNLYRPANAKPGEKLPAIFYVCGHSPRGRDGNKTDFHPFGVWFARHGYVCLIVDTLQYGEIAAYHHGTRNYQRWWWHSRGYAPAGVEAWNGVRGIDYLVGRPDVDPERIAVTGISGGGAATFWIAACDDRVKVAVPVSGMADLESYIPNLVINGHCDCMFLYNAFRWPWTRIAGLTAPRPMLFVNSDLDPIFPMDANERIITRLERLYSLYGAGDRVNAVVSIGGHDYRQDIRQASYRFINIHLKGDAREVHDSELRRVDGKRLTIPSEKLRVFPTDADLPRDELNTRIDEHFVPMADVAAPKAGEFDAWKKPLVAELRRVSFGYFPEKIAAAKKVGELDATRERVESEEGIEFRLRFPEGQTNESPGVMLAVLNEDEAGTMPAWLKQLDLAGKRLVLCEPRGVGATKWTRKNPGNYVERSHALLGRTVDAGRVWDVIAGVQSLAQRSTRRRNPPVLHVAGNGPSGLLAAYAAILDDRISGVTLVSPPATHMDNSAPQFLNVLRVCDVPDALGLVAPRPLSIVGVSPGDFKKTAAAYAAAAAAEQFSAR